MKHASKAIRVLYSYPQKLGAGRICYTAWQQVNGLAAAGADVLVFPGILHRPVAASVRVQPTLAWGKLRLPYKLLGGQRTLALHDYIVSKRIENLAGQIDVIHTWPMAARRTLEAARRLGIPTFLERPNAHTRFAYAVVQQECERLGITMPAGHEHAFNADYLRIEEEEYRLADYLLCPSDFVAGTFLDQGFPPEKLVRNQYGFDEKHFFQGRQDAISGRGLTVIFVGGCAPRKGLHYALDAWFRSRASETGTFLIAGDFIPGYAEILSAQLAHPSVKRLGHRSDVADLMRSADVFILPSIEEGSALVTSEARGCGCVLLVSEASGAVCQHEESAFVHKVGDVATLAGHISRLHEDRGLLAQMRASSLRTVHEITWTAAGVKLLQAYRDQLTSKDSTENRGNANWASKGSSSLRA